VDADGTARRKADGTTRRDAATTLAVLAPVALAAVVLDAPHTPTTFALGGGGAVVLELLLWLRAERVRAVWADRRVRVLSVVVAVGGGVGLAVLSGPWVLTVLIGGLCTYLVLLVVSVAWRRHRARTEND
jgi:hypothetical protein